MELGVLGTLTGIVLLNALQVSGDLPLPVLKFEEKIIEGEDTEVTCTFPSRDFHDVKLTIKGNGTAMRDCWPNKGDHPSVTCTIEVTRLMHHMDFTCEAQFTTRSLPRKMNLQTEPTITDCPDRLKWLEGQTVSFQCNATGYPQPNVTCGKSDANYRHGETFTATRSMSGEYTCYATNFDTTTKRVSVTVEFTCQRMAHWGQNISMRPVKESYVPDEEVRLSCPEEYRPNHSKIRCVTTNGTNAWNVTDLFCIYSPAGADNVWGPPGATIHHGDTLNVTCDYNSGFEGYVKYWCRGATRKSCNVIVKSGGSHSQYSIQDYTGSRRFTVIGTGLRPEDSNTYYCGMERAFADDMHEVTVTVLPGKCQSVADWGQNISMRPVKEYYGPDEEVTLSCPEKYRPNHSKIQCVRINGTNAWNVTDLFCIPEPTITDCPDRLKWLEGQTVSFQCNATGYPQPNVTCGKSDANYRHGETFTATRSMSGEYTCHATNFDTTTKRVSVTVEYKPQVLDVKVGGSLHNKGDEVRVTCQAGGSPDPALRWLTPSPDVQLSPDNQTVIIRSLQERHLGAYKCIAQNIHGSDEAETALELAVKPSVSLSVTPSSEVLEGDNVTLTCDASGFPPPVLSWNIPGNRKILNKSLFTIQGVQKGHLGSYECIAQNKHGNDTQKLQLTMGVKPKINQIQAQPSNAVSEGANVTLICVAEGAPTPTYTWEHPTSDVTYSPDKRALYIRGAKKSHGGNYECNVRNKHGSSKMTITVTVQESKESRAERRGPSTAAMLATLITLLYYVC